MSHEPHDQTQLAPTDDFEHALTALVLESYGRGAQIEGTWEITSTASVVPEWTITIEKTGWDESSTYEPAFLDE